MHGRGAGRQAGRRPTGCPTWIPPRRVLIAAPFALAASRAPAQEADPLLLTDAQRDWIRDHPVVRFTVSFEARPFLFLEGGRPAGYVVDLLAKAARLTGGPTRRTWTTWRISPAGVSPCRAA